MLKNFFKITKNKKVFTTTLNKNEMKSVIGGTGRVLMVDDSPSPPRETPPAKG